MILCVTDKRNRNEPLYTLHNQRLDEVKSAKYLGVEIATNLNWSKHVANVTDKANKSRGFVYRNLKGCPKNVQTHCYKSLVRPVMEYASPAWDPHQEYLCDMLENVQKRSARRIMHNFERTASSSDMVKKLEMQMLCAILIYCAILKCVNILNILS